ncbi:hypothetical protein [Prochlorococcus marinus]|uniref:hypothetical protein n=1 Tax=Prochlorococcus marinus TaxID=1219 RepID=UPI001AD97B38|nr:hypothetical protein [Prochlorococcus marinus]MBO8219731.1 hypothetical protein [Prochlorococcus marinus CUG1416]MBW3052094.1 hypothetical protein [Prochlorococcus marinus str. MU1416]
MTKRTQLNINIDEPLLKELKKLALSQNLPLSVFIRNSLRDIVSGNTEETISLKSPFTDKQAYNCTSFMRAIFEKMRLKKTFKNDLDEFSDLLKHIESSKQWNDVYTKRLKEVLLDEFATPFKAEELNEISRQRKCECPIYLGLKEWTGCIEYPTQDLICNLGGSLVPLIENQI